jgi:hypothetical protein
MVLVAERPELKQPPTAGSRSQDPDPTKGQWDQGTPGSQIPEPTQSPERQSGSQLPEVPSGLMDQEASRSQILDSTSGSDS